MRPALFICNGLIRSGSTWSFNVCRELTQRLAAHQRRPSASSYLHGPNLETFIQQHWEKAPGPAVIKAHELGPLALQSMQSGAARGICTFRDPRDSVASDLVFMGKGIEASLRRVDISLACLKVCENTDHILFVRYEEMMSNRLNEIRRIAHHMGLRADASAIAQVDAKTNLETSKALCRQIKTLPGSKVMHIESHRVDPFTHLHENHIGNARIGRWKDELSADQGRYLTEYFAPWLLKWGYESHATINAILSSQASPDCLGSAWLGTGLPPAFPAAALAGS